MLNNFIYAQTKDLFLEHLNANNVPEEAIVFIEDTRQIWNRGTYFGGDEIDQSVISDIQTSIAELQNSKVNIDALNDYAKKTDLPDLSAYLTNDSANAIYATITQYNDLNSKVDNNTADIANLKSVGAQKNVQSDWNATTGDALILNKPDLSVYLKSADASSTYATQAVTDDIQTSVNNLSGEISSNKSLTEAVGNRVSTLEGYFATTEDIDDIINQWKDVVDFLEGISDSENLDSILAAKANQSALDEVTSKVTELESKRDWKDVNNKIRNGNEFNIVPNNYVNRSMWFNYRTDGETSLENPIDEYIFGKGIANTTSNYASLLASGYKVYGGTSSQFLKADGSVDSTSYLPTSGGTLTDTLILQGAADNKLILNNTDGEQFNHISIRENNTEYGYLLWTSGATYINGIGNLVYNGNILLHTGNIGSQSVNYATSAGNAATATNADTLDGYHADIMVKSYIATTDNFTKFTDRAFFQTTYISGQGDFGSLVIPTWISNTESMYYTTELRFDNGSKNPKIRVTNPNGTSDWYTLARTVDNVASATKLQTPRTIWGQSFDGTGNVSNHLTGVSYIEFHDTTSSSGIYQGDILNPGLGANDIGIYTPKLYISGNVGIGKTDPAYTLDVNGTAGFTEVITPKLTIGSAVLSWLENALKIQSTPVVIDTALGIGMNPANKLDINGTIGCNGLNLRNSGRSTSLSSTATGHLTIGGHYIITDITNVTYDQLGSLIMAGTLIPGAKYCITDYQTTVSEGYVEWHPFQIIVTALSDNTLSEEASVISSDSYFANNDLSAWKVWYCYSNDTSRFEWATADGKGVIYRMIDEFGNDCPYDFKSIKLMRYQAGDASMNETWPSAGVWSNTTNAWYFSDEDDANILIGNGDTFVSISNSEYGLSFFTFYKDGVDASLTGVAHDNIMKPNYSDTGAQRINNNVFICNVETYGIVLKEYCFDNTFRNCHSIQLKNSCGYNYFSDSSNINFENNCYHNFIMMSKNINFGNECSYNNFEEVEKVNFLDFNTFNSLRFVEVIDFGIGCSGNSIILSDATHTSGITLGARSMFNSIQDVCTNVSLMSGVIWAQTSVALDNCTIYSTVKGSNEYRINIDKNAAFVSLNQNGTLVYWDDEDSYRIDAPAGEIAWNRTTFSYRSQSFTLTIPEASGPAKSHAVISNNNPNTDVVIALPTYYPYINFGEDAITIPSGESVEINVITDGTRYFIRHS